MNIQEFHINFDESRFADLRKRIAATRWPKGASFNGWQHGTPIDALREIMEYWSNGYDWKAKEAELNKYPQYIFEIDDVSLHFFNIPGKRPDAVPILMAHGWPDSFLRYANSCSIPINFAFMDYCIFNI